MPSYTHVPLALVFLFEKTENQIFQSHKESVVRLTETRHSLENRFKHKTLLKMSTQTAIITSRLNKKFTLNKSLSNDIEMLITALLAQYEIPRSTINYHN